MHLLLNKNTYFIGFLAGILKEFRLDLSQLFEYCGREFVSVSEMADFAKLDFATFSREFKKCFGQSPKKWLDEKRLQKANVGGKIKCRKRKIKCRIFATNYLSFNLKLKL